MMTGIEQWQPVHLAYLSAVDAGLGWQFGNAVFARRFDFDGRGRLDVMEKDVIEKICQDLTLDIPLSWTRYSPVAFAGVSWRVFSVCRFLFWKMMV